MISRIFHNSEYILKDKRVRVVGNYGDNIDYLLDGEVHTMRKHEFRINAERVGSDKACKSDNNGNKYRNVKFIAKWSDNKYYSCSACHKIDRVLRIKFPETLFFNGYTLSTRYNQYWLCSECLGKLKKAMEVKR